METNTRNYLNAERATDLGGRAGYSFWYPHQVVSDATLTLAEKRSVLATWASDVNSVESMPALRHLPGTPFPVTFSSIMDARLQLDALTEYRTASARKTTKLRDAGLYRPPFRAAPPMASMGQAGVSSPISRF